MGEAGAGDVFGVRNPDEADARRHALTDELDGRIDLGEILLFAVGRGARRRQEA